MKVGLAEVEAAAPATSRLPLPSPNPGFPFWARLPACQIQQPDSKRWKHHPNSRPAATRPWFPHLVSRRRNPEADQPPEPHSRGPLARARHVSKTDQLTAATTTTKVRSGSKKAQQPGALLCIRI